MVLCCSCQQFCACWGFKSVHRCVFGLFSCENSTLCGILAFFRVNTVKVATLLKCTIFTPVCLYIQFGISLRFAPAQRHKQYIYSPLSIKASILSLNGCKCSSADSEQTLCTSFSHPETTMERRCPKTERKTKFVFLYFICFHHQGLSHLKSTSTVVYRWMHKYPFISNTICHISI